MTSKRLRAHFMMGDGSPSFSELQEDGETVGAFTDRCAQIIATSEGHVVLNGMEWVE